MEKPIAWSLCFVLVCVAAALAQEPNSSPEKSPPSASAVQLVLELSDGSRVTGAPTVDELSITTDFADAKIEWSRLSSIDFTGDNHVAQVKAQNGDLLSGKLSLAEIKLKTDSGETSVPMAKVSKILVRAGSGGGDFVNSLGMELVPVPGTKVLFSIWDTRVQDYRAYAEANHGVDGSWKNAGFKQGDDHPVVKVNWADSTAFCVWLTQKERAGGKIRADQEYRLPADKEWSAAVGTAIYPWGNQWPPPQGAGNYYPDFHVDDFKNTSPVGSFKPNHYGLYDMGGNVWQWCGDWFRAGMSDDALAKGYSWYGDDGGGKKYRVVRGASWADRSDPVYFSSMFRDRGEPGSRRNNYGFRCVLAPVPAAK